MSLPNFYNIDYSTGNGHLLTNELKRLASGRTVISESAAKLAMMPEFQFRAKQLGLDRQPVLMTTLISGALFETISSNSKQSLETLTDLEIQQNLLTTFYNAAKRWAFNNPENAPTAYDYFISEHERDIAQKTYELQRLKLRQAPQKALPDLTAPLTAQSKQEIAERRKQFEVICNNCNQPGYPTVRQHYGRHDYAELVYHIDPAMQKGHRTCLIREITRDEFDRFKEKTPALKSILYKGEPYKKQKIQVANLKLQYPKLDKRSTKEDDVIECIKCHKPAKLKVSTDRVDGTNEQVFFDLYWHDHNHYHRGERITEQQYLERASNTQLGIHRKDKLRAAPQPAAA